MSKTVTIEREELNGVHEFVLRLDGERYGFLEFTRPEVGVMRIEYVEVAPSEFLEFCWDRGWPPNMLSLERYVWDKRGHQPAGNQ